MAKYNSVTLSQFRSPSNLEGGSKATSGLRFATSIFPGPLTKLALPNCEKALAFAIGWIFLISALLSNTHAEVPQDIRERKLAQTVKISGANPNQCGSGAIIAPGRLLTVTHVTDRICPMGEIACQDLTIFDSDEQELATVVPLRGDAVRSLDIAELKGPSIVAMTQEESTLGTPTVAGEVIIAGFPNCKTAEIRPGKITRVTSLFFEIDTEGSFGLSGGAVYGSSGEFLGLVDQAATLGGALSGRLLGGSFNLRAIRADKFFGAPALGADVASGDSAPSSDEGAPLKDPVSNYQSLQSRPLIDSINEGTLLLEHYRESVKPIQGFSRLSASGEFLAMASHFKRRFAEKVSSGELNSETSQLSLVIFSQLNTGIPKSTLMYLSQKLTSNSLQEVESAHLAPALLAVAEAAERFGGLRDALGADDINEDIKDLALAQNSYPGYEVMEASILLTLSLLVMLWSLTIGYAYGRSNGSRLRRLVVTLGVAVLGWPISFIAFLIFGGRSAPKIKRDSMTTPNESSARLR